MRSLLDINVLLALLDADHVDHTTAREWLEEHIGDGWASCAITQNGLVRILSQPRYPSPIPAAEAIRRLWRATRHGRHAFWPCEVSLLDPDFIHRDKILGPRQVTDLYLLALAVHRGGRLVTFDRGIVRSAVQGAEPRHLVTL